MNARSSKSFIDEGAWKKALDQHGDYYLIQFGHNDQKDISSLHTGADTTFAANLHRMVADVRAIGAVPILVTSLSRRNYKDGVLVDGPRHPTLKRRGRSLPTRYTSRSLDLNQADHGAAAPTHDPAAS